MTEKPFKLVNGEPSPIESAVVALNYIDCIMARDPYRDLPYSVEEYSPDMSFTLQTIIKDTRNTLPFAKNGILIAVFNLEHLPKLANGEDNVMGHDRYELRQVRGVIDLYKRSVQDENFVHELCSNEEKNLLATVIQMLKDQKPHS